MTTWTDFDYRVKKGSIISLKDLDGVWRVEKVYDQILDLQQLNAQRGFDNNNYDVHKGLSFNV